jgi:hypothetical protein
MQKMQNTGVAGFRLHLFRRPDVGVLRWQQLSAVACQSISAIRIGSATRRVRLLTN